MTPPPQHHREDSSVYRPGLHVLAILTACAVFPLIFVGAGVTSKDAGMAYPDGFVSDGYFLRNPPGWWERDDTRWEHGHRLTGRIVGVLAIGLAIWCWRRGGAIRTLGVCSLLAIVAQGLLGAFRVNEVSTTLAMVHGIFGQLCFCLACVVALVTGRTWHRDAGAFEVPSAGFLQRLCLIGTVVCILQLASGAAFRHFGSNPALLAHVFGATVITFLAGWIAMWVMGSASGGSAGRLLVRLGQSIAVLMVLQLLLGGFAFTVTVMGPPEAEWSRLVQWAVPSAHVAVGALLLAGLVLVTASTYHILRPTTEVHEAATGVPVTTS